LGGAALFIDRDGTINRDCPYCRDPSQLYIYEDAVELIREYNKKGYLVVIVTNQSGIGRGYFSESELKAFNDALLNELRLRGARVDALYYCPHTPDDRCGCRKPNTALVERAVKELDIDLSRSVVAGDREDIDGELARRLGIPFIHLNRKVEP